MDARNEEAVWHAVERRKEGYAAFSDRVWETPELCYNEVRSVAEHVAMLEREGARITRNLAGIPTAVMGEWGEEGPVIAILGEYDALAGLSQEAGIAEHREVEAGGRGHGCGHNLLGAASLLAAAAVKDWMAGNGIRGRVRYYGCPAEEGGAAKGFMVRDGVFDDVDIAISWHPAPFSGVNEARSLASTRMDFTFHGRSSHAAAAPELGRSALDAVELMNVGVNYMREHMPDEARIHYAVLDTGGSAQNVVQARAKVRYGIRAGDVPEMSALIERVKKVAQGAALMTETRVDIELVSNSANLLGNAPLERAMHDNFQRLGPPRFDEGDREYAARIRETLPDKDVAAAHRRVGIPLRADRLLCDVIVPLENRVQGGIGSTDVGDVSWAVPTVQARGATCAIGTSLHSWQMTAQGKSSYAHKGMVHVAKVMAGTAVDVLSDPDLLARAKADHRARTGGRQYESPLPKDLQPPFGAFR